VSSSLEIGTGTANRIIARSSLKKFSLVEQKTSIRNLNTLGIKSNKFVGNAKLDTLAIGKTGLCQKHQVALVQSKSASEISSV